MTLQMIHYIPPMYPLLVCIFLLLLSFSSQRTLTMFVGVVALRCVVLITKCHNSHKHSQSRLTTMTHVQLQFLFFSTNLKDYFICWHLNSKKDILMTELKCSNLACITAELAENRLKSYVQLRGISDVGINQKMPRLFFAGYISDRHLSVGT